MEAVLAPTSRASAYRPETAAISVGLALPHSWPYTIPLGALAHLLRRGSVTSVVADASASVRDLVIEAGLAASRRVWVEAAGEYRFEAAAPRPEARSRTSRTRSTTTDDVDVGARVTAIAREEGAHSHLDGAGRLGRQRRRRSRATPATSPMGRMGHVPRRSQRCRAQFAVMASWRVTARMMIGCT